MVARAETKVKEMRQSVDLLKNETKKLEVRLLNYASVVIYANQWWTKIMLKILNARNDSEHVMFHMNLHSKSPWRMLIYLKLVIGKSYQV